jgi:hypothetical protein
MAKKKWDDKTPTIDLSDLLDEPPGLLAAAGDKLASFDSEQIGPPEATILFWAEYHCACGRIFDGPMLDSPVLVRHSLLKHVCFGRYAPNGYIYRPASAESQFLEAEVHWEVKAIPKCIACAKTALVPDMRQIASPAKREAQMHETASPQELHALEQRRLEALRAEEADLKAYDRELAKRGRELEIAQSFQDIEPRI